MLYALLSAIGWSLANVTIPAASRRIGARAAMLLAIALGSVLLAAAACVVEGRPAAIDRGAAVRLAAAGVAAVFAYAGLFSALEHGRVSVIAPVVSAWSIVAAAIGLFAFDERLTPFAYVGAALVVLGNVLLGASVRDAGPNPSHAEERRAIRSAIISALGFGVLAPLLDAAGETVGRVWAPAFAWLAAALIAVPFAWRRRLLRGLSPTLGDLRVLALPILFESTGFLALSLAVAAAPLAVVAPISSLSTGFSVLLGVLFLHERLTLGGRLGAALASAGVVLIRL